MYKLENELVYSPSDLNAFLENECVTWLDRFNIEHPGELQRNQANEETKLIQLCGDEHERRYLGHLIDTGADLVTIDRNDSMALATTVQAMRQGREIIYQARLEHGEFAGWADFLFRIEEPSEWGGWQYEVWDTKLARSLKPYFAIQLCCYSELLNAMQRCLPERVAGWSLNSSPAVNALGFPLTATRLSAC